VTSPIVKGGRLIVEEPPPMPPFGLTPEDLKALDEMEVVPPAGAAEMGGPGSGPRPGHKSSWYERGSKAKVGVPRVIGPVDEQIAGHNVIEVEYAGVTGYVGTGEASSGWDPEDPEIAEALQAVADLRPSTVERVTVSFGAMSYQMKESGAVGAVDRSDPTHIYLAGRDVWGIADKMRQTQVNQNTYVREAGDVSMARSVVAHEMGHVAQGTSPMGREGSEAAIREADLAMLAAAGNPRSAIIGRMEQGMSRYGAMSYAEAAAETYLAWSVNDYDVDALADRPLLHATAVALGWGKGKP